MKTVEKRIVTVKCPFCQKDFKFELTEKEYQMYYEYLYMGMHLIQDVFPNRTPSERELLRGNGGMCGECWDKMFSFEEDEFEIDEDWDLEFNED